MEDPEVQRAANLEYVKMAHAEWLEAFKGVKEFSTNAIRMLFLLNGGAILALLALIGNMYGRSPADPSAFAKFVHAILPALLPFISGLVLAGIVSAIAYFNFSALESALPNSSTLTRWLRGQKIEPSKLLQHAPTVTARLAFLVGLFSLAAFAYGSWRVFQAFSFLSDTPT